MLLEVGAADVDMVTGLSAITGAADAAVDVEILKKSFKKILIILCYSKSKYAIQLKWLRRRFRQTHFLSLKL